MTRFFSQGKCFKLRESRVRIDWPTEQYNIFPVCINLFLDVRKGIDTQNRANKIGHCDFLFGRSKPLLGVDVRKMRAD